MNEYAKYSFALYLLCMCPVAVYAQVGSYVKIGHSSPGLSLGDGDNFGHGITSLGDLNDDGVIDIAVGALKHDDGIGASTDKGAVWVLFMNQNGTVDSSVKIAENRGGFTGNLNEGDLFGSGVGNAGDLDGDGNNELVVGAVGVDEGGADNGAIWVLFLNNNGTVRTQQRISENAGNFSDDLQSSNFGIDIASMGDLDGDGIPDLAVGAQQDQFPSNETGSVWILFMNRDGTVKAHQKISEGVGNFQGSLGQGDQFGRSIANIGDLDGDGINDLAVGAMHDGVFDRGAVWILLLNNDGTVKAHQKISDTQGGFSGALDTSDRLGRSVASFGDVNGDGVVDLAVGADGDDDRGTDAGAIWVMYLSVTGTVIGQSKITTSQGGFTGSVSQRNFFGIALGSLGDMDGDGRADLAVGAVGDSERGDDRGAVWILNSGPGNNTAPSSQGIPGVVVNEDASSYQLTLSNYFNDAEDGSSSLLYSVVSRSNPQLVSEAAITSNSAVLRLVFGSNQNGSSTVRVRARDSGGLIGEAVVNVTVNPVNDAPSFSAGTNITRPEDGGPQTITNWARNISAGPNESGQSLTFSAAATNSNLFSQSPSISNTGTLTFETRPNEFGVSVVTVVLQDDGGTANGGANRSAAHTLTITIDPVNDAPEASGIADITVNEDAPASAIELFPSFSDIEDGDPDLNFAVVNESNPGLADPTVEETTGRLIIPYAADANGDTEITVRAIDTGGRFVDDTFTITVLPVNDPPSFSIGTQISGFSSGTEVVRPQWAANISAGPPDESGQTLEFLVAANNLDIYSEVPDIDENGTLRFTPSPSVIGISEVEVRLMDDGGTERGGLDTSPLQTFTITTSENPEPPVILTVPSDTAVVDQLYTGMVEADGIPAPRYFLDKPPSPGSMDIDSISGVIQWTPSEEDRPSVSVRVVAINSAGEAPIDFTIQVQPAPQAPSITSQPSTEAALDGLYQYQVVATGYPAPTLSLIKPPTPERMSIDASGLIQWTPAVGDTVVNVLVEASNDVGTDRQPFSILVTNPPAPAIECRPADVTSPKTADLFTDVLTHGQDVSVTFEYGPDSGPRREVFGNPANLNNEAKEPVRVTIYDLLPGTSYTFTATATNRLGVSTNCQGVFTTAAYPEQTVVQADQGFGDYAQSESYRMVSVPGDVALDVAETLVGTEGVDWNVFYDNGGEDDGSGTNFFVSYRNTSTFEFRPGRGFWILSDGNWNVDRREVDNVPLDSTGTFAIELPHAGWTIIGNPYNQRIAWADVVTANPPLPSNAPLFSYEGSQSDFSFSNPFMEPYKGYYFENKYLDDQGNPLRFLRIPFAPAAGKSAQNSGTLPSSLHIALKTEGEFLAAARIDFIEEAQDGVGLFDHALGRSTEGGSRMRIVSHVESNSDRELVIESRSRIGDGQVFRLQIEHAQEVPAFLHIEGLKHFTEWSVALVDTESTRQYDVHDQAVVPLGTFEGSRSFDLIIGARDFVEDVKSTYVPDELMLHAPFPNPFRTATELQYTLPETQRVRISMYDVLGRLVQVLVDREVNAGFHRVAWHGHTPDGSPVSAGMYIFVFETESQRLSRTVVALR